MARRWFGFYAGWRKKRPIPTDVLPDIPMPGQPQTQDIELRDRELTIRKALDALPPKYRMVIVLRYFEGLSGAEMAEALKTSPKAIERLLARARSSLEPLLRPLHQEDR